MSDSKLPRPTMTVEVVQGPKNNRYKRRRGETRRLGADGYSKVLISIYNDDLERADGIVRRLKNSGLKRANLSWLVRVAIESLDVDELERSARRFR